MDVIDELKKQAFRNAIRLFRDSCYLAIQGSFETSYAIAVLSYEEIGKAAIADRQLDLVCLNPGSEQYAKETLLAFLKDHVAKQMWAAFDSGSEDKSLHKGLDVEKQNALYVNYDGNKVTSPNVSREKLLSLISEVYRALNGVGELPYYGIAGISSEKSKWQAKMDIQSVSEIYEKAISL
jgi:AbiV family abortive infection protein